MENVNVRKIKPVTQKQELKEMSDNTIYPYFSITLKYLPEAKSWKIGEKYRIVLDVEQKSLHIDEGRGHAGFDVVGIGVLPRETKKQEKKGKEKSYKRF